jgi:hypothetical protein
LALVHGSNPFANNWLNAPIGLNLMDNTTMPFLGVLGAPITFLLGPVATFNILLTVGFAASATAFFFMVRRFVTWWPAAFLGGLLYGYSPYATAEGSAHLMLMLGVVPPLVILFLDRAFRTKSGSVVGNGIALGACFVAQFYISTEVFASMAVMLLVAFVLFGAGVVSHRLEVDIRRLIGVVICVTVVSLVGIGYGAWTALAGPEHINGPAQTATALAGISSDPVGLIVPTTNQRFTFGHGALGDSLVAARDNNWHIVFDAALENGTYVGIPLLLVLAVGIWALRRRRIVWLCALMAAAAMVLSFGAHLHVDGHRTAIPLPFIVLTHLPLLKSSVASRYAGYFWLFAALLFAVIVDALFRALRSGRLSGQRRRAAVGSILVAVFALVPVVPAWPYASGPANVPAWFTDAARSLPVGSLVVVYPFANSTNASAMLWQATADVRFRMPGGYAVFTMPNGAASFASATSPLQTALALCSAGQMPVLTPAAIRTQLEAWKARLAVVSPSAPGAPCATRLFTSALGPARAQGGVLLWSPSSEAGRS